MIKVIILGTGGNAIDILDTINEINTTSRKMMYQCIDFLDDDKSKLGRAFLGINVLGPLDSAVNQMYV